MPIPSPAANRVFTLIKNKRALAKIVTSWDDADQYSIFNQMASLSANRPLDLTELGQDGLRYNPLTKKMYKKVKVTKANKVYSHTKKTAVSLLPSNGKMKLFGTERNFGIGLLFDLDACDTKKDKYLFTEEAITFSKWWKGKGSKKQLENRKIYTSHKKSEFQQLIEEKSKESTEPMPYSEALVGVNHRYSLKAIFVQPPTHQDIFLTKHDYYKMLMEAISRQAYIKTKLGLVLPIIILNAYREPIEYTLNQQLADMTDCQSIVSEQLLILLRGNNPLAYKKAKEILEIVGKNPSDSNLEKNKLNIDAVLEAIEVVHVAIKQANHDLTPDDKANLFFNITNFIEHRLHLLNSEIDFYNRSYQHDLINLVQYKQAKDSLKVAFDNLAYLYRDTLKLRKIDQTIEIELITEIDQKLRHISKKATSDNNYHQLFELYCFKIESRIKELLEKSALWTIGHKQKAEEIQLALNNLYKDKQKILGGYKEGNQQNTNIKDFFEYLSSYQKNLCHCSIKQALNKKRHGFFHKKDKLSNSYTIYLNDIKAFENENFSEIIDVAKSPSVNRHIRNRAS